VYAFAITGIAVFTVFSAWGLVALGGRLVDSQDIFELEFVIAIVRIIIAHDEDFRVVDGC
jgi:hypothetical protein